MGINLEERFVNFVTKSNKKYSNKFSYEKFIYVSAKMRGVIICPIHGEFMQSPDKHLQGKSGCQECGKEAISQSQRTKYNSDLESYLARLNLPENIQLIPQIT